MNVLKKHLLFLGFLLGISAIVLAVPVLAGDTAVIDVNVSTKLISLTVTPTSIDYGVLSENVESSLSDEIQITNDGNVNEDFSIKGADATTSDGGGNTWTLSSSNSGTNNYVHEYFEPPYSSSTAMTSSYQEFESGVVPSDKRRIKLRLTTPETNTVIGDYTTTVTVQATEAD